MGETPLFATRKEALSAATALHKRMEKGCWAVDVWKHEPGPGWTYRLKSTHLDLYPLLPIGYFCRLMLRCAYRSPGEEPASRWTDPNAAVARAIARGREMVQKDQEMIAAAVEGLDQPPLKGDTL